MSDWFAIIGVIVVFGILLAVLLLSGQVDGPSESDRAIAEAEGAVLDLDESSVIATPARRPIIESTLLPMGWVVLALGAVLAAWAWGFMDITPLGYSDTVNIDAVSQRSMLNTFGLVTAAIGAVMACAGHVVNEVRRGR